MDKKESKEALAGAEISLVLVIVPLTSDVDHHVIYRFDSAEHRDKIYAEACLTNPKSYTILKGTEVNGKQSWQSPLAPRPCFLCGFGDHLHSREKLSIRSHL